MRLSLACSFLWCPLRAYNSYSAACHVLPTQVKVSEVAPRELLANLAVLLPHLDGPSYTLRSGIVTAMGTIVTKVFPQSAEAELPESGNYLSHDVVTGITNGCYSWLPYA